jgi:DNA polymerase III subunit epsilon
LNRWLKPFLGQGDATSLQAAHWVAIDCETSGLDPATSRLLSVGAVKVHGGRIALGSAFSRLLRQATPSAEANIVVHGIGGEAQRGGDEPRDVLQAFLAYVGDDLPVAFHAPFDAAVLGRALKDAHLEPPREWLDCAQVAPALFPHARPSRGESRSLDDWLAEFGIECPARHDAAGDAYVTAQLLLVLLAEADRQGVRTVSALRALGRSARWLA